MANYLNSNTCYEGFKILINGKYFVDKSLILTKLNDIINTEQRFICVTRPRRFGKTTMANLIRNLL